MTTVLIAWIAAVVVTGLILGIVGFQVVGQAARAQRALAALRRDVEPRVGQLVGQLPEHPSGGRHSAEHLRGGEQVPSRR